MEADGIIQRKREPSNRLKVKRKRITLFKIMRFNSILIFLSPYNNILVKCQDFYGRRFIPLRWRLSNKAFLCR